MRGFIANTDLEWHQLLRAQARTGRPFEEVNFWRPSAEVLAWHLESRFLG